MSAPQDTGTFGDSGDRRTSADPAGAIPSLWYCLSSALPMSIVDMPSRGWFAHVPRLSRDSLPVDWYTALRCPLPGGHTRYLTWESLLGRGGNWPQVSLLFLGYPAWNPSAIWPRAAQLCLHLCTHCLQFSCAYSSRPTLPPPKTHTHSSHGGNGICISTLIQQTFTSASSFHGYYMKVFTTGPRFEVAIWALLYRSSGFLPTFFPLLLPSLLFYDLLLIGVPHCSVISTVSTCHPLMPFSPLAVFSTPHCLGCKSPHFCLWSPPMSPLHPPLLLVFLHFLWLLSY